MQPEFILPKMSPDNNLTGFFRRIFLVSLFEEFKYFDYGEKMDDKSHSKWSKIWSVLVNDIEIGKSDCKCTLSDEALTEHKEFYSKKNKECTCHQNEKNCTK